MGVFDPGVALHGFFPGGSTADDVAARLDAAAEREGFTLVSEEPVCRRYGERGSPPLPFAFDLKPSWSQIAMFRAHRAEFDAYGPVRLAGLFMRVCDGLVVRLARTDPGAGDGLVQERELAGDLEFVDWFTFLGAELLQRWDTEVLSRGPFHRVERCQNGGVALLLAEDPRLEGWSRRTAADYLGVRLRPMRVKSPDGEWTERDWR